MGNIKVSQLPSAGQLSNEDLFYIGKKDTSSGGYRPRRVTFGEIKESIKGGSGTGIQAFDELWKRSGTPSSGTLTLSGSRANYTGLVFVFKSGDRYSTIFKTNNEIDLALTSSGHLVLDKLLSGIVPVVGNGNPVGFVGLNSYVPSPEVTLQAALNAGTATGSTAMRQGSLVNSQYSGMGVSTDGNKSNLQTDLSQATGIELTAITNTSVTLSDVTTIDSIYGLTLVGGSGSGSGGVAQSASDKTDIINTIYPVGSIYTTIDKRFNPGTAFGGTWSVIGDGRCLLGCNQESNKVGTEIPSALPTLSVSGGTLSLQNTATTGASYGTGAANGGGSQTGSVSIYGTIYASRGNGTSVSMGDDVKPPSIGVIFWKRTA